MGIGGGNIVVKAHLSSIAAGQVAELALFWKEIAKVGITQKDGKCRIEWTHGTKRDEGPKVSAPDLWPKTSLRDDGLARLSYSLDGPTFTSMGGVITMGWDNYHDTGIALYSHNDFEAVGTIEFDCFSYAVLGASGPEVEAWTSRDQAAGF